MVIVFYGALAHSSNVPSPSGSIAAPMTPSVPAADASSPPAHTENRIPAKTIATAPAAPAPAKAPSLIQVLEGREADVVIWVCIAAVFFLVGWIAGGIFARRRERSHRTRLRF